MSGKGLKFLIKWQSLHSLSRSRSYEKQIEQNELHRRAKSEKVSPD